MKFRLFLMMPWLVGSVMPLFGQESPTPSLPPSAPLQSNEIREGIIFIERYSLSVEAEALLRDILKRERDLSQQALETERAKTQLAEKQAEAEKKRGDDFEKIIARLTKKPSFGYKLKQIFLLSNYN